MYGTTACQVEGDIIAQQEGHAPTGLYHQIARRAQLEQEADAAGDTSRRLAFQSFSSSFFWPDGEVPFMFAQENLFVENHARNAMRLMERQTALRFVERTTETDYVVITQSDGSCSSFVGRIGGAQTLNLDKDGFCPLATTMVRRESCGRVCAWLDVGRN